jgi:hypothetical protein
MKICEKCKTQNADTVMYCTTCGTQLPSAPVNPAPAAPVTPNPATPTTAFAAPTQAPTNAKKADMKTIILIAVAAVGLIIGIVGIVLAITSGNKKAETPAVTPTPVATDDDIETASISSNATGTAVKVGPYTLTIPKDYVFESTADGLIITDAAGIAWAANITHDSDVTYSQVSSNLKKIGEAFTAQGAKNVKTGTGKSGALSYLYIDMTDSDNIAKTVAIFKSDSGIFQAITSDGTANINHGVIDIIAPIIANAKSGKTSNRDLGFNITTKGVDTLEIGDAFSDLEEASEE